MINDISRAFFHAKAKREVFISLIDLMKEDDKKKDNATGARGPWFAPGEFADNLKSILNNNKDGGSQSMSNEGTQDSLEARRKSITIE